LNLGLKSPLVVQVELTENCNHSCYYCYNFFSHKDGKTLNVQDLERIVDQLKSYEVFSVVFTGGEPFMNPEGLNYSIERLDSGIDIYVNTNLSVPIYLKEIENLKKAKLVLVSFPSYDAGRFHETTGINDQKKVISNLELLASEGIPIGINQVVTKRNFNDVHATGTFLADKFKLKIFSSTPLVAVREEDTGYELNRDEILRVGEELIRIEKETGIKTDILTCIPPCVFPEDMSEHIMAKHGCSAGLDMAVIGSSGEVRRCTKLSKSYGNILNEELGVIWKRIMNHQKVDNPLCDSCNSGLGCYGGCELRAEVHNGIDPLVCGGQDFQPKTLAYGKNYHLAEIRTREEEDKILITDGGSSVFGNQQLWTFLTGLKRENLTREGIERDFGEQGLNLFNYLYNKGLIQDEIPNNSD